MASAATSFRPPHAVIMWCDDTRIFVELPAKEGPPFIVDFDLTDGGLRNALNILKVQKKTVGGSYKHQIDSRIKRPKDNYTQEQRDAAAAMLKKMGIT